MIEARRIGSDETRRARTLDGLARQVGGARAQANVAHSPEFQPSYHEVQIVRPARTGGYHVLSTWIVREA